jgi:hypothetical protein
LQTENQPPGFPGIALILMITGVVAYFWHDYRTKLGSVGKEYRLVENNALGEGLIMFKQYII